MPASIFTVETPYELKLAVSERIAGIGSSENVILIVEDYAQIDEWKAFLADNGSSTNFGVKVTTLIEFVQDVWDLFGNSGNIVTPLFRKHALSVPITLYRDFFGIECPVPDSIGTINLLSSMVEKGAGLAAFERGIDMFGGNGSTGEQAVWRAIGEYMAFLDEIHFVEMGDIMRRLIPFMGAYPNIIVAGLQDLAPMQIEFLENANAQVFFIKGTNAPAYALVDSLIARFAQGSSAEALKPSGVESSSEPRSQEIAALAEHIYNAGEPIEASGDVRFAFSTSRYSEAMLISQLVEEHVKSGYKPDDIVVTLNSPKLVEACMRHISDAGIASCAQYECMFADTRFGHAFIAMVRHESKLDLSDFIMSAFSGLSLEQAYELDRRWRSHRLLTVEQCLDEYGEKTSRAKAIVDSLRADDLYRLADLMISAMYASSQPDDFEAFLATRCSEMAKNAYEARLTSLSDIQSMIKVLVHSKVAVACTLIPADYKGSDIPPAVRIMALEGLARSEAKVAIISQLTADDFPVSQDDDVSVALFAKVGADISRDFLAETRNTFQRALSATKEKIVFERSLYNDEGEEQRSSVLLEEVVDCYREDLTDFDSIDVRTGLPEAFLQGEGRLAIFADDGNLEAISIRPQGASSGQHDDRDRVIVPFHRIEDLSPSELQDIGEALVKREDGSPRAISVTSLESYLACPRRWFIERQMRVESIDAELDNMVLGSFVHELLQRFYEALREGGGGPTRVDGLTRARSDAIIDAIASDCLDRALKSGEPNPPVATNEIEQLDIDACIQQVKRLVWDDRLFIKRFAPAHFELSFGRDGEFEFAGHPMLGIVDRVDVDDSGHAIVIDYKASLGSEYYPNSKASGDLAIAPKVQPLIYASAVKRLLGFDVVGSIFRSYKKPKRIAGVYVGSQVKSTDLFGYNKGELTPSEFEDLLERTEERAAEAISRMSQGDILPNPTDKYVCEYCPVAASCPKAV